jgi:hypothetical protein
VLTPSATLGKRREELYFYLLFFFVMIPFNGTAVANSVIMPSHGIIIGRLKAFAVVEISFIPAGL